jgi:hypothetical protein
MPRRYWTHAEEQRLRDLFAESARTCVISAELNRTESQITAKAWSIGITRDLSTRLKPATVRAREAVLHAASGKHGIAVAELSGQSVHAVQVAVTALLRKGKLFRAKMSHKGVRYFADAAAASAYEAAHRRPVTPVAVRATGRTPWPADAPIHYPKDKHGRPLYKITVAPPPPERPLRTNTWAL